MDFTTDRDIGYMGYPLVMTNSVQLNIAIGIVDLPIKNRDVQ